MESDELFNEKVKSGFETGIKPFEISYIPIIGLYDSKPFAFRTKVLIHSTLLGDLNELDYSRVTDSSDVCLSLFKHILVRVILDCLKLQSLNSTFKYVTVRCPKEVVSSCDIYHELKELLKAYPKFNPSRLCIEFPDDFIFEDKDKLDITIKDLKLLKFKTAIRDIGDIDFPATKLVYLNPDIVFLNKEITSWGKEKAKQAVLHGFIDYLVSVTPNVIAEGDEDVFRFLQSSNCTGFIESNENTISLQDVIKLTKEEEENA